jgi:hypothetical protein
MRIERDWQKMVRKACEESTCNDNRPLPDHRTTFNKLVAAAATDTAFSWRGFQKWAEGFQDSWAFRGHADAAWDLETYLDRETFLHCGRRDSRLMWRLAAVHEKPLLREFQERAHQYLTHLPGDDEIIDWLALMQHYGASTRLLDWTRSPYVALYFAVEKGVPLPRKEKRLAAKLHGKRSRPQRSAAVWAIDCDWALKESAKSCGQFHSNLSHAELSSKMSRFVNERLAGEADSPGSCGMVFPVDPRHANERMAPSRASFYAVPSITLHSISPS